MWQPLYLSLNTLLAGVLGKSQSVPACRMIAEERNGRKAWQFSVVDEKMATHKPEGTSNIYRVAAKCKSDGALHLARE
jgi:hypothetical protein